MITAITSFLSTTISPSMVLEVSGKPPGLTRWIKNVSHSFELNAVGLCIMQIFHLNRKKLKQSSDFKIQKLYHFWEYFLSVAEKSVVLIFVRVFYIRRHKYFISRVYERSFKTFSFIFLVHMLLVSRIKKNRYQRKLICLFSIKYRNQHLFLNKHQVHRRYFINWWGYINFKCIHQNILSQKFCKTIISKNVI